MPASALKPPADGSVSSHPDAFFDAIILVSFGGPEGMDDVLPFLENVTRGRGIPRERLLEVAHHYELFGGVSPINGQNRDLIAALRSELDAHGIDLPIFGFSHCRDVVAAVSRAGGMGVLGGSGFSAEHLEEELRWLDEHTDGRPYGIDLLMASKYDKGLQAQKLDIDAILPAAHVAFLREAMDAAGIARLRVMRSKNKEWLSWPVGQIVGDMKETLSVRQVIQGMLEEYAESLEHMNSVV